MKKVHSVAAMAILIVAACGAENGEAERDLAADTASLPNTDILLGQLIGAEGGAISVVEIEGIVSGPGYQNQPALLGPGEGRFYYVSEGASGKTDIWVHDYYVSEQFPLTDTSNQSEFSPKPAPGGRLSFIQESADGSMTRVHAIDEVGDSGYAVTEFAPVGYYEWLNDGETLAVYHRGEAPALYFIDMASGDAKKIFEGVGRSLQSSPDGSRLYATQVGEEGRHRLFEIDVASGEKSFLIQLPDLTQDFRILFDDDQAPAVVFSANGPQLLEYSFGESREWRVAADIKEIGYGEISRIAIAKSSVTIDGEKVIVHGPIIFVAEALAD